MLFIFQKELDELVEKQLKLINELEEAVKEEAEKARKRLDKED